MEKRVENYKDLEVWKQGIGLATEVYKITSRFPKQEQYGLISQIQRSATAVPANIAEGWGRGQTKEYILFLRIARGSLMELETHLIVSGRLGYLGNDSLGEFQEKIGEISRMLNGLISSLKKKLV